MKQIRVCVIGGGASGLIASIFAAKEGAAVTLLEKNEKPAKKHLMTGNGRCNFTNEYHVITVITKKSHNLFVKCLSNFRWKKR